ncbi:MAG: type II secretion system protein [Oscillospiraceae bacterium]|nr:type II secretion system protein [Oscillospiraceae bacterium]
MKKMKGFTLIELIVVIAIIGILAAILVPVMVSYIKDTRVTQFNSNAKSIYSGAQLAITDYNNGLTAGWDAEIVPDCIYTGASDCIGYPENGGDPCNLTKYLGVEFDGYFAFKTDNMGLTCIYALWSNEPIPASAVEQLTLEEVNASLGEDLAMGCYPLKIGS